MIHFAVCFMLPGGLQRRVALPSEEHSMTRADDLPLPLPGLDVFFSRTQPEVIKKEMSVSLASRSFSIH